MPIYEIRKEVTNMYPSNYWKHKVACMADDQVIAIYYTKLGRKEKKKLIEPEVPVKKKDKYVQMSIFDFIKE